MSLPVVTVPANFGRENLTAPAHNNLTLRVAGGELHANSMVLSLNSAIIARFTGQYQMSHIDCEEFGEAAVKCFLDCCYSGETPLLSTAVFREVYKMAVVFRVGWLEGRCVAFFRETSDSLATFESTKFALMEALYAYRVVRKKILFRILYKRLWWRREVKERVLEWWVSEVWSHESSYEDMRLCSKLALRDTDMLIQPLVERLESLQEKNGTVRVVESIRVLLNSDTLSLCRQKDPNLYGRLAEVLAQSDQPEILAGILAKEIVPSQWSFASDSEDEIPVQTAADKPIPFLDLGDEYKACGGIMELVRQLVLDRRVRGLAMLLDAVQQWEAFTSGTGLSVPAYEREEVLELLRNPVEPLDCYQYSLIMTSHVREWHRKLAHTSTVRQAVFRSDLIFDHGGSLFEAVGRVMVLEIDKTSEINGCGRSDRETCAVAVGVAQHSAPGGFSVQLLGDATSLEQPGVIHFHQAMEVKRIRLSLRVTTVRKIEPSKSGSIKCRGNYINYFSYFVPLSWCGRPEKDGSWPDLDSLLKYHKIYPLGVEAFSVDLVLLYNQS